MVKILLIYINVIGAQINPNSGIAAGRPQGSPAQVMFLCCQVCLSNFHHLWYCLVLIIYDPCFFSSFGCMFVLYKLKCTCICFYRHMVTHEIQNFLFGISHFWNNDRTFEMTWTPLVCKTCWFRLFDIHCSPISIQALMEWIRLKSNLQT